MAAGVEEVGELAAVRPQRPVAQRARLARAGAAAEQRAPQKRGSVESDAPSNCSLIKIGSPLARLARALKVLRVRGVGAGLDAVHLLAQFRSHAASPPISSGVGKPSSKYTA